jgi:hypothetical protein
MVNISISLAAFAAIHLAAQKSRVAEARADWKGHLFTSYATRVSYRFASLRSGCIGSVGLPTRQFGHDNQPTSQVRPKPTVEALCPRASGPPASSKVEQRLQRRDPRRLRGTGGRAPGPADGSVCHSPRLSSNRAT